MFQRKSISSPVEAQEPYEVAAGIWSTDATAIVFGYLDADRQEPPKTRNGRTCTNERKQSATSASQQKPAIAKGVINRIREAHRDDPTDEFVFHPYRLHVEAREVSRRERRGDARRQLQESVHKGRKARMKTVSREDELIERAANPRTGIVSPFVTSEDSSRDSLENDYVAAGQVRAAKETEKRNASNGRWKQDSQGWRIVQSQTLSPTTRATNDKSGRQISVKTLKDELLTEMSGVDNFEPNNKANDQMPQYQNSIEQAYRYNGGEHAVIDSDTLPSPEQCALKGPSTSPGKLQTIQRKEVGSGATPKHKAIKTVIVSNNVGALPSLPIIHQIQENPNTCITSPSQTAPGAGPMTSIDTETAMSGLPHQQSRTAKGIPSLSRVGALQEGHYQPSPPTGQSLKEAPIDHTTTSAALCHHLTRPRFLHPSHFASLATSSYRRPVQLLPVRQRTLEEKRRAAEEACTTATFSTTVAKQDRKPIFQRQDGLDTVQKVNNRTTTSLQRQGQHLRQRNTFLNTGKSSPNRLEDKTDAKTNSGHPFSRAPRQSCAMQDIVDMGGAQHAARAAMLEETHIQKLWGDKHLQKQESRPQSAAIVQRPIWRSDGNDGCIHMCGHHGDTNDVESRAKCGSANGRLEEQRQPAELAGCTSEDGVCFAGQRAKEDDDNQDSNDIRLTQQIKLVYRCILVQRALEVKQWLQTIECWFQTSTLVAYVLHKIWDVIRHILSILRRASPAVNVLRAPMVAPQDYLTAIRDLVLAGVYFLVMMNVCMAVGRLVLFLVRVVYWMSHPIKFLSMLLRWCVLG
ncbi:MAG: hypothetical protein Q9164_000132 [Protoblastenia rupestris]